MTNEQLENQYFYCLLWNDADQWDALAMAYYERGYVDNAARCFRKAAEIRDCDFAEAMPARLAVREEVG
jgi:tetratricopeptide (TPR) repeat protein